MTAQAAGELSSPLIPPRNHFAGPLGGLSFVCSPRLIVLGGCAMAAKAQATRGSGAPGAMSAADIHC